MGRRRGSGALGLLPWRLWRRRWRRRRWTTASPGKYSAENRDSEEEEENDYDDVWAHNIHGQEPDIRVFQVTKVSKKYRIDAATGIEWFLVV